MRRRYRTPESVSVGGTTKEARTVGPPTVARQAPAGDVRRRRRRSIWRPDRRSACQRIRRI